MNILGFIRNNLRAPTIVKKGDIYSINGLDPYLVRDSLEILYETKKVGKNIFLNATNTTLSFHEFFLPDIHYTILRLINNKDTLGKKLPIRRFAQVLALIESETWLKPLNPKPEVDFSLLNDMTFKPLEHQMDFLENIKYRKLQYLLKGSILNAAPGSGKTLTSLFAAKLLELDTVVIIGPLNTVRRVWENTIKIAYKHPQTYWLSVEDKSLTTPYDFYVVHKEFLSKFEEMIKFIRNKKIMVVIDECHNFNELKSAQTLNLIRVVKALNPYYTLLMSGTPFKALAIEVIPSLRLIDSFMTEEAEASFKAIYKGNNTKAIEILKNRLGFISVIVKKEELKLKEPIFTTLNIILEDGEKYTLDYVKAEMIGFIKKQTEIYKKRRPQDLIFFNMCLKEHEASLRKPADIKAFDIYKKNLDIVINHPNVFDIPERIILCNKYEKENIKPSIKKEFRAQFKDIKALIKYPKLKIMGECLGFVLNKARQECFMALARKINYEEIIEATIKKTIIFTNYISVADTVIKTLSDKYNPIGVYGEQVSNLAGSVKIFDENPTINPLVATYLALSTAVPLIMADTIILIDMPWRDYILQQAIARVWRLGNTGNTYVFMTKLDTQGKPNIVSRSIDIISWAKDQVEEITGVKSPIEFTEDNIGTEDFNGNIDRTNYMSW